MTDTSVETPETDVEVQPHHLKALSRKVLEFVCRQCGFHLVVSTPESVDDEEVAQSVKCQSCGTGLEPFDRLSIQDAVQRQTDTVAEAPAGPETPVADLPETGAASSERLPDQPPSSPETPPATPAAQTHAEELGVDLAQVEGTGTDGKITKADVAQAAETQTAPTETPTWIAGEETTEQA